MASPGWIIRKLSLLQSSAPGHLVSLIPRTFIPNQAISCFTFSHFPFYSKVLTFQHGIFRWNYFLRTLVVGISRDDDREFRTSFPVERGSASPWLTALFMPMSFGKIATSCHVYGKTKRGVFWYGVFLLLLVDCLAQSGTTPHHKLYPAPMTWTHYHHLLTYSKPGDGIHHRAIAELLDLTSNNYIITDLVLTSEGDSLNRLQNVNQSSSIELWCTVGTKKQRWWLILTLGCYCCIETHLQQQSAAATAQLHLCIYTVYCCF